MAAAPATTSTANKENGVVVEPLAGRLTRSSTSKAASASLVEAASPLFSWSDGCDRFSVTSDDFTCLNEDQVSQASATRR